MTIEERLRADLSRAGAVLPPGNVDLLDTMKRGRAVRRRMQLTAVAGSLAVLLAVTGGVIALGRTSSEVGPVPPVEEPTPRETSVPRPELSGVEPRLEEWLRTIQDGSADEAWSMLTPEAQEIVGRDRFDRLMAGALPEGLGAFADAQDFDHVVVSSEGGVAHVVGIASGEITRETDTRFAAMAISIVVHDEEILIDDGIVDRDRYYDRVAAFASASLGPQTYSRGEFLTVELADPEGMTGAYIALDDDRRPLKTTFDASSGTIQAELDRDLEAGTHVATVIVVDASSRLYPEAILFEAGP